jgi:hypothetical protein
MKRETLFLWVAMTLAAGCSKKDAKSTEGGNPLNAPADYLGGLNQAKKLAEKTVDLAALNNAIALFHGQEDRYPKDLNELVQGRYLREVPPAPAGMRLTYNPATGEVNMVRQ